MPLNAAEGALDPTVRRYRSTRRWSVCAGRQRGIQSLGEDATGTALRECRHPSRVHRGCSAGGGSRRRCLRALPRTPAKPFRDCCPTAPGPSAAWRARQWIGRMPSGTASSTAEALCGDGGSEVDLAPSWTRESDPTGRSGVSPEVPLTNRSRALPIVMGERVGMAHMTVDRLPVRRGDLLVRGKQDHLVAGTREVALHDMAAMSRVQPAEWSVDDMGQRPAARTREGP